MADDRATTDNDEELEQQEGDEFDSFEDELEKTVGEALDEDDDEDDEDDDLDDDDDDLDEDDEDEDGAAEGKGPKRDPETGQFTKKDDEPAAAGAQAATPAADAKPGEVKPDVGAAAAADAKPAAADEKPAAAWQPFAVKADKENVPIPEAHVRRENGFLYVAIPEAQEARFNARISAGIAGERMWRQMGQAMRELEAKKNAPPRKTDIEIEHELLMAMIKPHLPELFDDDRLALYEAQVKAAKLEHQMQYDAAESKRLAEASQPAWEETQASGILNTIGEVIAHFPELQGLTPEQIEEVYSRELLPVKNSVFFRDGEEAFVHSQYIYDRLKSKAEYIKATAKTTTAAPASAEPPKGQAPNNATKPATDAAERFNRGVDAGTKPRTTSVKANREERPSREPNRPARGKRRRSPAAQRARAEEDWRKTSQAYLNSDSLDFDEPDLTDEDEA